MHVCVCVCVCVRVRAPVLVSVHDTFFFLPFGMFMVEVLDLKKKRSGASNSNLHATLI